MDVSDIISRQLADAQSSWAIGTFGAVAEFHRDADEGVVLSAHGAVTARGGIRLRAAGKVRLVAWECPTAGGSWTHGVALCLPADEATMSGRTTVTELGPDMEALGEAERGAILFDLGIGAPHCDVCVRTADPEALRVLRAAVGRPLGKTGLFEAMPELSPSRVFLSRLGRIEVRTRIPRPRGRTPDGPHTHVLPQLLRSRRTHSANLPLPPSVVPGAEIFPASAIHDEHGRRRPFDAAKHQAFQSLLAEYGDPLCLKAKRDTMDAVRESRPPRDDPSYTRAQRLARRVALRQAAQISGPSRALAAWQAAFDAA
jgi:hypothetical protein